jgi:hypothetical protein
MDEACQLPGQLLLEASPWFHAEHILSAAGTAAPPEASLCDWCGGPAAAASCGEDEGGGGKGGGGGGAEPGCGTCGCALYCSAACAAAAAPHHALNCWRLRRLAVCGAVLQPRSSAGAAPIFDYPEVDN